CFVRPVRNPVLTDFCTRLTNIGQAAVDGAELFPAVLVRFGDWLPDDDVLFCSWGAFERHQLHAVRRFHAVPYPFDARHLNLKSAYARHLARGRRLGMAQALKREGLPLDGTHHRALDDALNIARLLPRIVGAMPS